jgi:hypothetical protein
MSNKPSLNVLIFNLELELFNLTERRKERRRLLQSGNAGAADAAQLQADMADGSARMMVLSKAIELELKGQGRLEHADFFHFQLQVLLSDPGQASDVKLRSFIEAMSLPSGATIDSLRREVNMAIDQHSEMDHVWRMAFVVALATIAAAAGAPLAAVATKQAIGQQVLEDAITTFISTTAAEGAVELIVHQDQRPKQPDDVANREEAQTAYVPTEEVVRLVIPDRRTPDGRIVSAAEQLGDDNYEENDSVRVNDWDHPDSTIYEADTSESLDYLKRYDADLPAEVPSQRPSSPAEQDKSDQDYGGFDR